jgi:hypothetical protein
LTVLVFMKIFFIIGDRVCASIMGASLISLYY